MNFLVLPHLGLGDQFIMNGLVHFFHQQFKAESILIFAYNNYQKKTLEHLYSDYPNIQMIYIEHDPKGDFGPLITSLQGLPLMSMVTYHLKTYYLLNFGIHSEYRTGCFPNETWIDTFYKQGKVDPLIRYSHFTLPNSMENAEVIYRKVVDKIGSKYVVLHDDPSRGFCFNNKFLLRLFEKHNVSELPVIYLGKNRVDYEPYEDLNNHDVSIELNCDSLLDLTIVLEKATECHLMDSSIVCLIDLMKNCQASLHIHDYIRKSIDPNHISFQNKRWSIWYEKDL